MTRGRINHVLAVLFVVLAVWFYVSKEVTTALLSAVWVAALELFGWLEARQ